jgi:DNA-binding transcriptional LysR family regulator
MLAFERRICKTAPAQLLGAQNAPIKTRFDGPRFVPVFRLRGGRRQLRQCRSNVSRRIRKLEQDVGAQLMRRTTRRMSLTETGALFYERCAVIGADVEEARKALHSLHASVRGPLHVSCPPMVGRIYFAPLFAEFCLKYPDVALHVTLKNNVIDLVGEGVDVALRLTDEPGSTVVARELARIDWIFCASPKYLRANGVPKVPEDLARHAWLGQRGRLALEMTRGTEHRRVVVSSRLECTDFSFLCEAAVAGLGIGFLPSYVASDALRRGKLRTVLDDFRLSQSPGDSLYAITLATRFPPPQVRALLEFLKERFAPRAPWEHAGTGGRTRPEASPKGKRRG